MTGFPGETPEEFAQTMETCRRAGFSRMHVFPYSEPGKIGARGSKLYQMLKKGHHGVRLSEDDWRRLVLFMDASGAYLSHDHDVDAQLQGRVVEPVLE